MLTNTNKLLIDSIADELVVPNQSIAGVEQNSQTIGPNREARKQN